MRARARSHPYLPGRKTVVPGLYFFFVAGSNGVPNSAQWTNIDLMLFLNLTEPPRFVATTGPDSVAATVAIVAAKCSAS